jgi:hypothetical protein
MDLHIPLFLSGTISCFETRLPTANKVASDHDCIHVHVTSGHTWDPYNESVGHSEASIRASLGQMPRERGQEMSPIVSIALSAAVREERTLVDKLAASSTLQLAALRSQPTLPVEAEPNMLEEAIKNISTTATLPLSKKGKILPEELAKRCWCIGVDTAKKTLECTTQLAIRDLSHTTGGRRLKLYTLQLPIEVPKVEC